MFREAYLLTRDDRGLDGPVPKGTWLLYESPERGDPLGFSEFPSKEELELRMASLGYEFAGPSGLPRVDSWRRGGA